MKNRITKANDTINIGTKNNKIGIKLNTILHLEGAVNYTYLYTSNHKYLISKTLKKIESSLDTSQFIRTHKSHIVNKTHVASTQYDGNTSVVFLSNGTEVEISRRRRKDVKRLLNIF